MTALRLRSLLILMILQSIWISGLLSASEILGNDTKTGTVYLNSTYRQDIQKVIDSLKTSPNIQTVKKSKHEVKTYISGFKQQISALQKEILQLNNALEGLGKVSPDGVAADHRGLSELIALRQKKELELAELRLLLMTSEEVIDQLDDYIQREQKENLYYRDRPLWRFFSDTGDEEIETTEKSSYVPSSSTSALLFLASITAAFLIFSRLQQTRAFITSNSARKNTIHLLTLILTKRSLLFHSYLAVLCFLTILICLLFPIFSKHHLVALTILFFSTTR